MKNYPIEDFKFGVVLVVAFCILLYIANIIYHSFSPKEVTIDSTKFACTAAEPFGIETRCTQYSMNKGVR